MPREIAYDPFCERCARLRLPYKEFNKGAKKNVFEATYSKDILPELNEY